MDDKKLGTADIVGISSVAVFFFATFLPWFKVTVSGDAEALYSSADLPSANGWDAGFFWSGFPLLLGLAMLALLLLPKVAPDVTLPDMPPFVPLALGGAAAVLVLIKLLIGADVGDGVLVEGIDVSRSFGIFIAFLASLGMAAAGFLKMKETGDAPMGGGTTPPRPF